MSDLGVLVQIAFRNLFSSFLNVVIGGIILVGTLLVVVGSSLLNSVDSAMSQSITGSVGGHIQVYSAKSKDDLALFGNWMFPDISAIPDFSKVKEPLLAIDNVKAVIPMAINGANVMYGNSIDLALEKLRKAVTKKGSDASGAESREKINSLKDHVRQMISVIQSDSKKLAVMASEQAMDAQSVQALDRAASTEFWNTFDRDPLGHLEFLENKIASLVPDADFIILSYVGTDVENFSHSFDRMDIVDGQIVPKGQRGLLLAKYIYEKQFKLKTAYRMDKIHEALHDESKTIAKDPDLRQFIKENRNQTREIILQLDSISTASVVNRLQGTLKSSEKDLNKLLSEFFDVNDANFFERYRFFYDQIVPMLELYRIRPGDMLTIKAFTKSGFIQSINIKVYGTFQFKGLEKSGLAGGLSLMDLMSFRDLYGYVSADKLAEIRQLQSKSGTKILDRDRAEAELFGGGSILGEAKQQTINDQAELGEGTHAVRTSQLIDRVYTRDEIEKGVVLNAAVILKDPAKIDPTMRAIEEVSKRDNLGLKVITWQKAAGSIGQFVFVAKVALYAAVFIIFVVALVIINNAVMMATLQRVREIGTMRAIGAQRSFVLQMVLVETLVLGLAFGMLGILSGAGIMKWLGHVGIPAGNEFLYFFFSGPRLFPVLGASNLIAAFVIIFIVTSFSTLYPAIIATRVSPLQAMQSED